MQSFLSDSVNFIVNNTKNNATFSILSVCLLLFSEIVIFAARIYWDKIKNNVFAHYLNWRLSGYFYFI